jgi:hypothetical protein
VVRKVSLPAYVVEIEYQSADDAEDRLLQVYELLLGLVGSLEPSSEGGETT